MQQQFFPKWMINDHRWPCHHHHQKQKQKRETKHLHPINWLKRRKKERSSLSVCLANERESRPKTHWGSQVKQNNNCAWLSFAFFSICHWQMIGARRRPGESGVEIGSLHEEDEDVSQCVNKWHSVCLLFSISLLFVISFPEIHLCSPGSSQKQLPY